MAQGVPRPAGLLLMLAVTAGVVTALPKPFDRNNRTIYHFHIHKCGGTSFCADAVANNETVPDGFPRSNCNGQGDNPQGSHAIGGKYNENFDCDGRLAAMGNVTYFQTENVFNQRMLECPDRLLIGMQMRHPIRRIISHISYETRLRSDNTAKARAETFSPRPNSDTRYGSATVNNYYIRSLLGSVVYEAPLGTITRAHLEAAKRVLDQFVIFILEHAEWHEEMLACYYDWDERAQQAEGTHLRDSHGSSSAWAEENLDDEWRAKLEELNALDLELFRYAVGLSAEQLGACRDAQNARS
ncbi:uncharacterized protein MONBRDRAFT_7338 [Monosiga brevicollis MX1]|uniref:Uncharacterized protein n=1 Tax=Monosiga brevicollis TaxID=81824 RepID=A9UWN6_MONBE|nr:uncharacterized protein MONBRDRAFT_7338 [Monosiga brevicollis MX1]EDQ90076.1 predicted protein [Monosiga brevicollis MX1]|eukprot:XP_001744843.1 hypothetical protein [Monosiga brevicollis MX1]